MLILDKKKGLKTRISIKLGKEKQIQLKISRRKVIMKIRAEINERVNRKTIGKKSGKLKTGYLKRLINLTKLYPDRI